MSEIKTATTGPHKTHILLLLIAILAIVIVAWGCETYRQNQRLAEQKEWCSGWNQRTSSEWYWSDELECVMR